MRFLADLATQGEQICAELGPGTVELLKERNWPGEVRELQGTVTTVARSCWAARSPGAAKNGRVVLTVEDFKDYLARRAEVFGELDSSTPASQRDAASETPTAVHPVVDPGGSPSARKDRWT